MKGRFAICLCLAATAACAGAEPRAPWSGSRVKGSPEPPPPYVAAPVFETLELSEVLEIVPHDGSVVVLENRGRVWCFENHPRDPGPPFLMADLKVKHPALDHLYGIAFHPRWRENRQVFVTYTVGAKIADGTRLSRFLLDENDPPRLVLESEQVLLTWLSGGHNGAHLQFGPDGMLYISTGDAEAPAPPDLLNTGQDNSDLLSAILRIDVDPTGPALPYRIPPDNPFVGKSGVRPEIWAFGFRNPWKMSFDSRGRLWCGDVGWELWEMIHLVTRGSNHGWSALEGPQPIKLETLSALAPVTAPVAAHPHTEAASITGGYVYEGKKLPALRGACIYGDYETGKIWALWHDGGKVTRHEEIADTPHRIVSFGLLPDGELVYAHWDKTAAFFELVPNPETGRAEEFPRRLNGTGIFQNTAAQTLAPGVYEFDVAEPVWQDGLEARRFIALPGAGAVASTIQRRADGTVQRASTQWPADSVLVKTLINESRPVETQLLHYDGAHWQGYSYAWNEAGTDAELVPAEGAQKQLHGRAHAYPARAECMRCHTPWTGHALAFCPQQLAPGAGADVLRADDALRLGLVNAEFFETSSARLAGADDAPLEDRARAWLHANCAHCHRLHGGGSVAFKANIELELDAMEMLDGAPLRGDFGLPGARIVAPGRPWASTLIARIAQGGPGHMPLIGAREVDTRGLDLLWRWIESLPAPAGREEGDTDFAAALKQALADGTRDSWNKLVNDQPERALVLARLLDADGVLRLAFMESTHHLDAHPNAFIAALFERFMPPEKRRVRLGAAPDSAAILALKGDPARGAALLSPFGALASCLACHRHRDHGISIGPDLTHVGARLTREQLLESLLQPSKTIAPEYRAHSLVTAGGEVRTCFVVNGTDPEVTVKLLTGETLTYAREGIQLTPLPASLMPEGLLQSLSAQEAADLLEYLASRK
ncbi:MAG TPA: hypothetical protein DIT64_21980 [Verrucomicrobiales bacterium]|nr:hypothetical protein [Verrucomicrobiales bacterium]